MADVQRIGLVWIEAPVEGSAPWHHLKGTLRRLHALGFKHSLVAFSTRQSRVLRLSAALAKGIRVVIRSDVVLVRWHPVAIPILLIARLFRTPVVCLVQGAFDDLTAAHPVTRRIPLLESVVAWGLRRSTAVACVHSGLASYLSDYVQFNPSRIRVLPNGYPLHSDLGRTLLTLDQLPASYVFFGGALAPWQGLETMVQATEHTEWPTSTSLVVAGDGPLRHFVDPSPGPRVRYLGQVSGADIRFLLENAICSLSPKLLTPTTARGISPFKVLEAGLASRAVIATALPGQQEYVEKHECGILVTSGDPAELATAVARLVEDSDLRRKLGENGRKAAEQSAWERKANVLGDLIEIAYTRP